MLVKAFRYIKTSTIIIFTGFVVSCGQGDGTNALIATCTTSSDVEFTLPRYLLAAGEAELTVTDSCLPLKSSTITVSDGTETINIGITFDALGRADVTINFGTTNAATATLSVALADTLTVSYTDSADQLVQDTAEITDVLASGIYSDTNTAPTVPVAEIVTRIPGNKVTNVDTESQAVALYDGLFTLEAEYDTTQPGSAATGFVFEFGPTRIQNSSYELPDASTGDVACAEQWDCFNSPFTVSSEFTTSPGPVAHTGTQSFKQFGFDGGASQTMDVSVGDTVTASAWALNWTGDQLNNAALFNLAFFGNGPDPISSTDLWIDAQGGRGPVLPAQDGDSPSDWTRYELTGTAPVGATSARVLILHQLLTEVTVPASGSIFWDDVSMTIEPGAVGEDVSIFNVLRFAMETASLGTVADLQVVLDDAADVSATVYLSDYTATASADVAGWSTFEIPLSDFTGIDTTRVTSLAFLNASSTVGAPPTLADATLYFDDINFAVGAALPPAAAPVLTGMLVNSAIEGVTYQTTTQSGMTNAAGEFEYIQGQDVTFSIGGIVLGTVPGAAVVTPVELTDSLDPTSQAAINMLVFLQSIDDDQDHTNGIQISAFTQAAAVAETLNFDQASGAFTAAVTTVVNAVTEPDNAVVSESEALDNFYDTYAALNGTETFNWLFPGYAPVGAPGFDLVWSDEFNTGTVPSDYWVRETGTGSNGWGNDEWQVYTSDPANLSVADGYLNISAQCSTAPDCTDVTANKRTGTITSARIKTEGNFSFKYGIIKARIKPPAGNGSWPAFWMLGANFSTVGWPFTGEIDIMEMAPANLGDKTTSFAMHWCNDATAASPTDCFPQGYQTSSAKLTLDDSLGDDFHVFEARWDENGVTGYIDGVQYFTRTIDAGSMSEFLEEFFLLLNVAVGGNFGGAPDLSTTWPQTMLVDYVRVFQPTGGTGTSTIVPPASSVSGVTTSLDVSAASADAGTPVTVTVVAKDSNGLVIPTSAGTVVINATGSGSVDPVMDAGNGSYTATVTSAVAETVTISGTIAGQPITATADISFLPGAADVSTTTIDVAPATVESNGTDTSTVTVQLKDSNGNDTSIISGALAIQSSSGSGLENVSSLMNIGGGVYTASVTNTVAEQVTISGTIDGNAITDSEIITFTVGAVSGATTTIDASPGSVIADGVSSSTITVQARDGSNNIITNDVGMVVLSSTGSASVGSASYAGNGSYTATVTSLVAEAVTISGTIAGNAITDTADVTFSPGAFSGAGSTIDASFNSAVNNGVSTVTVTVTARDANGNMLGVDQGDVVSLSKTGSALVSAVTNVGDGTYTATVTNTVEEMTTISGDITSGPATGAITDTADISFAPAQGLYSESSTTSVLSYSEIVETTAGCNTTTTMEVPDASVTSHEGGFSLGAAFSSGGSGCNGYAFNFLKPATSTTTFEYGPQDFDSLNAADPDVLGTAGEGFQIFGIVWNAADTVFQYQYGPFTAPNSAAVATTSFSSIESGEGENGSSDQYLNIFNDYESGEHMNADRRLHAIVLLEHTICTTSVGSTTLINDCESKSISEFDTNGLYRLSFKAKAPTVGGIGSSPIGTGPGGQFAAAEAFIKTIDPDASFSLTNEIEVDMTAVSSASWTTFNIDFNVLDIDALDGQLLQFGFSNKASEYQSTGVLYDDVSFSIVPVDVSARSRLSFAMNKTEDVAANTLLDLEVKIEDDLGGNASVFLSNYTPAFSNGDWDIYDIPLADFGSGVDLTVVKTVGFYDASSVIVGSSSGVPTLIDATVYFDDVHFIE